MSTDEAVKAIKELLPNGKIGMAEKEFGFEVWVKGEHVTAFKFGETLDVAFANLLAHVQFQISQ